MKELEKDLRAGKTYEEFIKGTVIYIKKKTL
jgi:hypothetical protein